MGKSGARYGIDLLDALEKHGIENGNQLWVKIGGSKGTAYLLWEGTAKQIQMETMNKLHNIIGIHPTDYIVNKNHDE